MTGDAGAGRAALLFRFVQVELPWELGIADGRYLVRAAGDPDGPPTHVLVLSTLGAARRDGARWGGARWGGARRGGARRAGAGWPGAGRIDPEPPPAPVSTTRATVIDVGRPLEGPREAQAWLHRAGDGDLAAGLEVLDRALHALRLASADPYVPPIGARDPIARRIGFGAGEQVADGRWSAAREMPPPADGGGAGRRRRRARALAPQERLAALLGAREAALVCEELTLRARLSLDGGRTREAALQLSVALDTALAELAHDPALAERLGELRERRTAIVDAAAAAVLGPVGAAGAEAVQDVLGRLEAALRARAAGR